ncbi:hypothetical protein GCM10027425_03100 [Alteromonas gracilis]
MSRADRLDNAWGVAPEVDEARLHAVRPLVFAGAVALAMPGVAVPGAGLPLSEVGGLLLAGLTLLSRPEARIPGWLPLLLGGVVAMLGLSALLNEVDGTRRLAHVAVWALLAVGVASGRLHLLSMMRGVAFGLVAATSLSLAGVLSGRAGYEGRLTGLFADPNVAGYYQIVLGTAAVTFVATRLRRAGFVALLLAGIYRTLSRTSLLAVLVAGFWITLGRRLGRVGAIAVVAGMVYLVDNLPAEIRLFGPFSQREGSDALRDRIISEENSVIATTPWFGNGPGTSRVLVDGQQFFFHNSYLGARNEGGWPLLMVLIALFALAFWSLFHPDVRRHPRTAWVQLPLIATLVCAVSLGEVLLELPAAVAIGLAVAQRTHLARDPYLRRVGLSERQIARLDQSDTSGPEPETAGGSSSRVGPAGRPRPDAPRRPVPVGEATPPPSTDPRARRTPPSGAARGPRRPPPQRHR